jgi:hypothetical protein
MVGQENDKYDEVMKKAMQAQDRGMTITRLKTKQTITSSDGKATFPLFETKVTRTDRVWDPNNFSLHLLQEKTPLLLDRSNTPRGAQRSIALERTFDKDIWVYNKKSMDELATSTQKDLKRGKFYKRKIMRIKRQRSKSLNKSQ